MSHVLNGETTTYGYDKRAIVAANVPDGRAIEYTYDNDGSLLSALTAGAATTSFGYDGMGRFVEVRGLEGALTVIQYDAGGLPVFRPPRGGRRSARQLRARRRQGADRDRLPVDR